MNTNLATASEPSTDADFIQSAPFTDGPAWKAAEAEGHDMTIIASLLKMSLEERFQTHAAALATVNMLRGAKLEHG